MAYLICGEGLNGQVKIDLAAGWTDVYPLRGIIDLQGFILDPILRDQVPQWNLDGRVSGRLAFTSGALLRDASLGGWIHLNQLQLGASDQSERFELQNEEPIQVRLENGGFRFEHASLHGHNRTEISFEGGGNARGALGLRLQGNLDLAFLESLSSEIENSEGQLTTQVHLRGTVRDPKVYGSAEVQHGHFTFSKLPFAEIEDLSGQIEFSERRAIFSSFEAKLAEGIVRLEGATNIRNGSLDNYDFDLHLQDASLRPEDGIQVGMSGQAHLSWSRQNELPLLRGQLHIDRARYERPIQLSPTLGELYRPRRAQVERYDPNADNVELDLRVVNRSPLQIRNNLFDLDIGIDDRDQMFRIVGTDQRYGIVGRLSITRGTVRFRNTNLTVTRGDIRFSDETRIDPSFDLLARTEIRRQQTSADLTAPAWRVQVRAHGTLDGFRLDATSQPQLSQEDLMLLLTVGMTSAEAQQLQAGDVGGTALEALSAIAGVNEEITNAVRIIDDFAITTRYSQVTGRPEPMVDDRKNELPIEFGSARPPDLRAKNVPFKPVLNGTWETKQAFRLFTTTSIANLHPLLEILVSISIGDWNSNNKRDALCANTAQQGQIGAQ